MVKKIPKNPKLRNVKKLIISLVFLVIIFGGSAKALAADSVRLSANVVARQSFQTINDFDYSAVNSNVQSQVSKSDNDHQSNFYSRLVLKIKQMFF